MIATVINAAAVLLGALFGVFLKEKIADKFRNAVTLSVGLVTLVLGMRMALGGGTILLTIAALILGGLAGTAMNLEGAVLKFGDALRRLLSVREDKGSFARGFLDASLLFCVGPMTILGSLEAGFRGEYAILLTKSAMDGFMSVVLAATLGPGVAAAVLSILVIQGGLTLLAGGLGPFVTEGIIGELSALGGYLILMIGLNLLKLRTVKTANFLPSIVLILIFAWVHEAVPAWTL